MPPEVPSIVQPHLLRHVLAPASPRVDTPDLSRPKSSLPAPPWQYCLCIYISRLPVFSLPVLFPVDNPCAAMLKCPSTRALHCPCPHSRVSAPMSARPRSCSRRRHHGYIGRKSTKKTRAKEAPVRPSAGMINRDHYSSPASTSPYPGRGRRISFMVTTASPQQYCLCIYVSRPPVPVPAPPAAPSCPQSSFQLPISVLPCLNAPLLAP